MDLQIEVSNPHYHPDKDNGYTKKRDLTVKPYWVANEKHEGYPIIMPPRETALFEDRQELHIHFPSYLQVKINGELFMARVKVSTEMFNPVVHIDNVDADRLAIKTGDKATL